MSVCTYMARPFDVFPFFEIFAWWKFTGNLFITAIPSLSIDTKFLSINSQEEFERRERGENPYSKRSFLDEILSENAYLTFIQRNCFTMRLFPSWISFIVSTSSYFFVFFLFFSPHRKENERVKFI